MEIKEMVEVVMVADRIKNDLHKWVGQWEGMDDFHKAIKWDNSLEKYVRSAACHYDREISDIVLEEMGVLYELTEMENRGGDSV